MSGITDEQLRTATTLITAQGDVSTVPREMFVELVQASMAGGATGTIALAAMARALVAVALELVDEAVGRPLTAELGVDIDGVLQRVQVALALRAD